MCIMNIILKIKIIIQPGIVQMASSPPLLQERCPLKAGGEVIAGAQMMPIG